MHDIAVLLYLVGQKPQKVAATAGASCKRILKTPYVHLRFAGGVQAHLHVSWLWPETRRRLTIAGSEAMLTYDEGAEGDLAQETCCIRPPTLR